MQKKKTIFLAVILVLGIAFMLSLFNVETGRAANLVQNPGFETGALSPWSGSGKTVVGTTNAHSGTYAMKVVATGGYGQQVVTVSPNTSYVLTAWLKTTTTGTQGKVGVKDYGGTDTFQISTSNTYTQLTVYFTTGASNTSATIYCSKPTSDYIYCDDFNLALADGPTATPSPTNTTPTATETNTPIGSTSTPTATKTSTPIGGSDSPIPNAVVVGRWDTTGNVDTSWWAAPYLKVNFTGTTAKLQLAAAAPFYAQIDGGSFVYYAASSTLVNLTSVPLAAGTHSLRVVCTEAGSTQPTQIKVQGLVLDPGASTSLPTTSDKLIEFVGDSITYGFKLNKATLDSAGWLIGENLGVEHTHIAYSSVPLVSNAVFSPGMETAYFKLQTPKTSNPTDWNFNTYQAQVVVINLGENDGRVGVDPTVFQNSYVTFLSNVRSKFPTAQILALRPYSGKMATQVSAAVDSRINAGDNRVLYIDTTDWLSGGGDLFAGGHPTESGNLKIVSRLQPIVAPYLQ